MVRECDGHLVDECKHPIEVPALAVVTKKIEFDSIPPPS